ncbi:MAG: hypothetical protein HY235_14555 [Acidobacteria bacterium]|nr:hypothetical protein [Acidobacteriota bacterium]
MSFFADDATAFPAGQPFISGKQQLRAHYAKMFAAPDFQISWKPVKGDVAASGDLGLHDRRG